MIGGGRATSFTSLRKILCDRCQREFELGPVRPAQSQAADPQDALQMCANSISMRFLSRRDCSNASVLASARLTGQNLSPRSVRVGGDDRVRTHCVSLLVPSKEAADCNHQHDAGRG